MTTDANPLLAPPVRDRRGRKAFMLIELAVACFVIGSCLLALLALARAGRRATDDAENETRASLFAQDAFSTLRLFSDRAAIDENPGAWTNFWIGLANDKSVTQFPGFVTSDVFYHWTEEEGPPTLHGDGRPHTNIWRSSAMAADALPEAAMIYRMTIATEGGDEEHPSDFNQVQVTLHVWSGLTRIHPETYTFFGLFANPGRMP